MSNFNLKAAAAIAAQGVVLVGVQFDGDPREYKYLAHEDDKLEAGNVVIVPTTEDSVEHHLTNPTECLRSVSVSKVESVENLTLDADFDPQFIVCKVQQDDYITRSAGLNDIAMLINKNRNRTARSSVLAQFGLEKPLSLSGPSVDDGELTA